MFYVGLDLGQKQDPSALAIMDRVNVSIGRDRLGDELFEVQHQVVYLRRFQVQTDYTRIVEQTYQLLHTPELRGRARLIVDATGVGVAVYDLLVKAKLSPVPITITAGNEVKTTVTGGFNVPKKDLVSKMQVLLETKRLKFAADLPEVDLLVEELTSFGSKITEAGNEIYGNLRSGTHDDLVLAVAIAAWYSDLYGYSGFMPPKKRQPSPIELIFAGK